MDNWVDPSNNQLGIMSAAPADTAIRPTGLQSVSANQAMRTASSAAAAERQASPFYGLPQRAKGLVEAIFPSRAGGSSTNSYIPPRDLGMPIGGLTELPPEPVWRPPDDHYAPQNNAPPSEGRIVSGGGKAGGGVPVGTPNWRGLGLQGPTHQVDGVSDAGQADAGFGYTQRVARALGLDPRHIRYTDGPGGAGLQGPGLMPVGGGSGADPPTGNLVVSSPPQTNKGLGDRVLNSLDSAGRWIDSLFHVDQPAQNGSPQATPASDAYHAVLNWMNTPLPVPAAVQNNMYQSAYPIATAPLNGNLWHDFLVTQAREQATDEMGSAALIPTTKGAAALDAASLLDPAVRVVGPALGNLALDGLIQGSEMVGSDQGLLLLQTRRIGLADLPAMAEKLGAVEPTAARE